MKDEQQRTIYNWGNSHPDPLCDFSLRSEKDISWKKKTESKAIAIIFREWQRGTEPRAKPGVIHVSQDQKQSQSINIANDEHGMTDYVKCPYFTDSHVEFLKKRLDYGDVKAQVETGRLYDQIQKVKILIYKGKTKEIFCHHLNGTTCASPLKKQDTCWLIRHSD